MRPSSEGASAAFTSGVCEAMSSRFDAYQATIGARGSREVRAAFSASTNAVVPDASLP